MDLERLGAPEQSRRFLALYRELSGETYPPSLVHHYIAYRAHVRAKVACLRHEQGDLESAAAAASLLDLTLDHLERGRVVLTLVGGLPGTGKSTLAAGIADAREWSVIRTDEVRRDLVAVAQAARAPAAYREGIYRPEVTEATYNTMLERAHQALEFGESVVLDATWSDARWRTRAADVARETSSDLLEFQCAAPAEVAAGRSVRRVEAGVDPSDATPEVAARMAASFDPWPSATTIDTSGLREDALATALSELDSALCPVAYTTIPT
jgi:predicted kinase